MLDLPQSCICCEIVLVQKDDYTNLFIWNLWDTGFWGVELGWWFGSVSIRRGCIWWGQDIVNEGYDLHHGLLICWNTRCRSGINIVYYRVSCVHNPLGEMYGLYIRLLRIVSLCYNLSKAVYSHVYCSALYIVLYCTVF